MFQRPHLIHTVQTKNSDLQVEPPTPTPSIYTRTTRRQKAALLRVVTSSRWVLRSENLQHFLFFFFFYFRLLISEFNLMYMYMYNSKYMYMYIYVCIYMFVWLGHMGSGSQTMVRIRLVVHGLKPVECRKIAKKYIYILKKFIVASLEPESKRINWEIIWRKFQKCLMWNINIKIWS